MQLTYQKYPLDSSKHFIRTFEMLSNPSGQKWIHGSPFLESSSSLEPPLPRKKFSINFDPLPKLYSLDESCTFIINLKGEKCAQPKIQTLPLSASCISTEISEENAQSDEGKNIATAASASKIKSKTGHFQKGSKFGRNLIERIRDPHSSQGLQRAILEADSSTVNEVISRV